MAKTKIDDGFFSNLVDGAEFSGKYEIPVLLRQEIDVPKNMIPFDKRRVVKDKDQAVDFYMHDAMFRQIITNTSHYVDELKEFASVISPDCSLYRDMPLCLQITNTYLNHAVGFYLQKQGIKVIPNVRWGDERSFEFCFEGVPKNNIVSVSTHGCIHSYENKHYFRIGLEAMLKEVRPKIVLVHGEMPDEVFVDLLSSANFVHYESYIKIKKEGL